jgi:anti-sigma factor RsiW
VRCSSCEPLLDRYVEGTLTPREMARVRAHLLNCPHCEMLLAELRVVDALLATTQTPQLAPNFTFAVMADVRTTPMNIRRRLSPWSIVTFYVIVAWIVLGVLYTLFGGHTLLVDTSAFARAGTQAFTALTAVERGFSSTTPLLLGSVVGVLLLDALLVTGAVALYRVVRARHVARSSEAA